VACCGLSGVREVERGRLVVVCKDEWSTCGGCGFCVFVVTHACCDVSGVWSGHGYARVSRVFVFFFFFFFLGWFLLYVFPWGGSPSVSLGGGLSRWARLAGVAVEVFFFFFPVFFFFFFFFVWFFCVVFVVCCV